MAFGDKENIKEIKPQTMNQSSKRLIPNVTNKLNLLYHEHTGKAGLFVKHISTTKGFTYSAGEKYLLAFASRVKSYFQAQQLAVRFC